MERKKRTRGILVILPEQVNVFTITSRDKRSYLMTTQELTEALETQNVRGRLVGLLVKEFPKDAKNAEDWAQRALARAYKNAGAFYDVEGLIGYAREAAIGIALNEKERDMDRRKTLRGLPRYKATKDPLRHIDYKIDLERAVKAVVGHPTLRQAMWALRFEQWTWEDVIEALPKDKKIGAWNMALSRANADLKKEMRRKGYRG